MKIIVCVKPVLLHNKEDILRSGTITGRAYVMNRPDLYAVEEARRIRGTIPGSTVEAVMLGPSGAEEVLREATARGVDTACHVVTGRDLPTARDAAMQLAGYIKKQEFDLVITGIMAEDTGDGSMGPMLAAFLGIPFAWGVMMLGCTIDQPEVHVECELEAGDRLGADLSLPALVSVGTGINHPPYPPLSARLRAREMKIQCVQCGETGRFLHETIESAEPLTSDRHAVLLQGTSQEKAGDLARIFRQRAFL